MSEVRPSDLSSQPAAPQSSPEHVWIEKTIVRTRLDRQQGQHQLGEALWSPQRDAGDRDIYANMRDVKPGDLILHLTDNEAFTGISRAAAVVDDTFKGVEGTEWGGRPGYRIALCDFQRLTPPLARSMLFGDPEIVERLRAIVVGPRGRGLFYNDRMELNQGAYLTEASPALVQVLNAAYRKQVGQDLPLVPTQSIYLQAIPFINGPALRLTSRDIGLLRESRLRKRYAEISVDEREAYRRIDLVLRTLGEAARQGLGLGTNFDVKLTSGFHVESGVRGALPKDLWFGVYNTANLPEFAGMPQIFTIVSERGVEVGFAPAIHPADFSQQGIRDKVRDAAPRIFARLPSPGSPLARQLSAQLSRLPNWTFRKKTRLEPGGGEFNSFGEWLAFLKSKRGQEWAGGSVSRYISADELDRPGFELNVIIREAAALFAPLMRDVTPTSASTELDETDPTTGDSVLLIDDRAPQSIPPLFERPPYPVERALYGLFLSRETFESWIAVWRGKRNLLLQGAPGVGKSFVARRLAYALMGFEDPSRVAMVQFHQSYSYEDFVQGLRPQEAGGFALEDGAFVAFCRRALDDPDETYVFIIDEINRGNLSKVFGELMLLIEPDKRQPSWATRLAYGSSDPAKAGDRKHRPFYVPGNVFLIGMMNTADRSLAVVDYALRRRFAFVAAQPAFDRPEFSAFLSSKGVPLLLINRIRNRFGLLNAEIAQDHTNLGPGFCIGHSFFVPRDGAQEFGEDWYNAIVETEILPLLSEYWFDDAGKVETWRRELLARDA